MIPDQNPAYGDLEWLPVNEAVMDRALEVQQLLAAHSGNSHRRPIPAPSNHALRAAPRLEAGPRYLRAVRSSVLMFLAAALTRSSRFLRSSAEARTRGEGTVSAARVRLPWVTGAEAAHTPV